MTINSELLRQHLKTWKEKLLQDPVRAEHDKAQRVDRVAYYQAHTAEKIRAMSEEDIFEYIAKLWAMLIWGNKKYVVDKLVWCFWLLPEKLEGAGVEGHRQASAALRTDSVRTLPPTPQTSMRNLAATYIDRRFERKLT